MTWRPSAVFCGFFAIIFVSWMPVQFSTAIDPCKQAPSPDEVAATAACAQELGDSPTFECTDVCMLKKMRVIVDGSIPKSNWNAWVEKKFPAKFRKALIDKLGTCNKLYSNVPVNSKCDENDDFYKCKEDIIDAVCV